MIYEGIHSLCFSCGRIGHRKEAYPVTIKKPETPAEGGSIGCGVEKSSYQGAYQRGMHDSHSSSTGSGASNDRGADTEEDRYDPWMLVARRKPVQKRTNAKGNSENHFNHGLGQSVNRFRHEPKGNSWG